jgi:hypothetical protein
MELEELEEFGLTMDKVYNEVNQSHDVGHQQAANIAGGATSKRSNQACPTTDEKI